MDADHYTYRKCSVEGCDGIHKGRGYCLKHYRQWARGGVKQDRTECAQCGKPFDPFNANAMYCGNACKVKAWKARGQQGKQPKPESFKGKRFCVVYAEYCLGCGKPFVSRDKRLYCADACKPRAPKEIKECKCCGAEFQAPPDAHQTAFCSESCRKTALDAIKRIHRAKRRGYETAAGSEDVDPFRVFDRDRWRCQLCRKKTPRSKRGTVHPDAPELDHIIPLSAGGEHTYRNTQCACRKCNITKHARPRGQLLLIG